MAGSTGPDLVQDGLILAYDDIDRNSYLPGIGNKMNDLAGVSNLQLSSNTVGSSSGLTWANNITNITISILLEKTATTTEYAYHPVNKWDGTLGKASFVLYHFGNYPGNLQDGLIGWYAGAGSVWQALGFHGTMVTGNIWNVVLQYNSTSGAYIWTNGVKVSGPNAGGILGNGGSASDIGILGPDAYINSKVHQALFYNRRLSDDEILRNYNQYYKFKVRT
jgi:hypothetical protein